MVLTFSIRLHHGQFFFQQVALYIPEDLARHSTRDVRGSQQLTVEILHFRSHHVVIMPRGKRTQTAESFVLHLLVLMLDEVHQHIEHTILNRHLVKTIEFHISAFEVLNTHF